MSILKKECYADRELRGKRFELQDHFRKKVRPLCCLFDEIGKISWTSNNGTSKKGLTIKGTIGNIPNKEKAVK